MTGTSLDVVVMPAEVQDLFSPDRGDRVAKQARVAAPAKCFDDAINYAVLRAVQTGKRQRLYKGKGTLTKNWWLIIVLEESIGQAQ